MVVEFLSGTYDAPARDNPVSWHRLGVAGQQEVRLPKHRWQIARYSLTPEALSPRRAASSSATVGTTEKVSAGLSGIYRNKIPRSTVVLGVSSGRRIISAPSPGLQSPTGKINILIMHVPRQAARRRFIHASMSSRCHPTLRLPILKGRGEYTRVHVPPDGRFRNAEYLGELFCSD